MAMLFAPMNVAFRALGPPFDLCLLARAGVIATVTTPRRGPIRVVLGLLATAYCPALAVAMIPLETSDDCGGFRIF
ncbi:MAG: hypothetical protein ACXWDM_11195 [Nocardioides sp.]